MYVLGLSAMGHDPAAALVGEQGVVAAIEEGKLTRERSVEGIPRAAIRFCMERAGVEWRDIDRIAIASRPKHACRRRIALRARLAPFSPISSSYFINKSLGELGRELNNFRILKQMAGSPEDRVEGLDHHLCHAASAFYASPFDRALIVVLDEEGDGRAGLAGLGQDSRIREHTSLAFPHSLAWVFTQVTQLLGFRPHADENKAQWLSLAGDPLFADLFLEMLRSGPKGPPHLNAKFFNRGFTGELSFSDQFYRRIGARRQAEPFGIPRLEDPLRANLAASLQQACGVVVSEWLESLRSQTHEKNLCLSGGLFLNALLVAAVEKSTGFDRIFVQPAAGNEGTSLGAAWLAWHQALNRPRVQPMSSLYWGPKYSNEDVKQVLDNCKAAYQWCDSEDLKIDAALELLNAGKIVAWYQGAAEFGPRALGNRSLLASPWAPYVTENLNDYVKHRESFRPFALAIPEDDCVEYFDCSKNGRYMTTMATAKDKVCKLFDSHASGFVSKNRLVRVHVVTRDDNPLLWKLLKRFGEKGSAPMLVNTSFNLFGEPLVVTPRDAVRSYYCSGTDALVAESFLLRKR
jgi:carbamoyltransferase